MDYKHNDLMFDFISLFSFIIGLENLNKNNEQIEALEKHLAEQDRQYERIIKLLEGAKYERENKRNAKESN